MKITLRNHINMLALAITALANAHVSLADGPFAGSLGAGSPSFAPTDVFRIVCPTGTASVRARVTNPNGNPTDEITVQVIAPFGRARSAISLEGVTPPTAVLTGGAGTYLVSVHKDSKRIASSYSIALDCYRTTSAPIAGNQSVLVQNQ
jgi:hypothetical protein